MKTATEFLPQAIRSILPQLEAAYMEWNQKVNVISRKDIQFETRHLLHSLSLTQVHDFSQSRHVLDVGTGGGFPGIPLAICYPDVEFTLVDSIGKKTKVVYDIAQQFGLDNVTVINGRVEELNLPHTIDTIVTRAVAPTETITYWCQKVKKTKDGKYLMLKGGDLTEELKDFPQAKLYDIAEFYPLDFFETKKIVEVPFKK